MIEVGLEYNEKCQPRPWCLYRVGGDWEQHSHFKEKKDARKVKELIKAKRYPTKRKYKFAMQRLLTEEEFKKLNKKQRYYNPQKGIR